MEKEIIENSMKETVGDRIRIARNNKGYSLRKLGEIVGKQAQLLHQYETLERNPKDDNLLLIANALDVDILWLKYGDFCIERSDSGIAVHMIYSSEKIKAIGKYLNEPFNEENPDVTKYDLMVQEAETAVKNCDWDVLYMAMRLIDKLGNVDKNMYDNFWI